MYINNNDSRYPCTNWHGGAAVQITGCKGLPKTLSGTVELCIDNGQRMAIYNTADYLRTVIEGDVLTLTNEPEPAAPTAEELLQAARADALTRISGKCSLTIMSGITVDGKRYSLSEFDQLSLNAAWNRANMGEAEIPFAADGETLTLYPSDQIKRIGKTAYNWGTANRSYYAELDTWRKRETDTAILAAMKYGSKLPDDLMSKLTTDLTNSGIDVSTLSGLLTA